jgi:ACS family glucarate transporter-like MFS transporter
MTPPNGHPAGPVPRPTRVRYSVLGLLCLLAMITYLDRAMYGSARNDLMASVGANPADFFLVLTAFQLAYALFEIPTGWLGDRFGPRSTLLRIVLWWSVCIALTPLVGMLVPGVGFDLLGSPATLGLVVLIALQFLFGMGEAGAFPNISKAAYNWFPAHQRGFAKGAVWMSARFLGGLTPVIWLLLTGYAGLDWRQTLWVFAGAATVWCVIFWLWFRNVPEEHPSTNEQERVVINAGKGETSARGAVPWGTLLRSRNLWFLCLMYMGTNYCWYFLMYYLPGALRGQYFLSRGPAVEQALQAHPAAAGLAGPAAAAGSELVYGDRITPALLGGGPLLVGMFGCYLGGVLSDLYFRKTGDRKWSRRVFGMLGYGLAGVAYAAATLFTGKDDFWMFALCLIAVGFCNDLMMGPAWATTQDVGRQYAAIVGGTMNMVGNLGATLGNYVTGRVLKSYTTDGVLDTQGYVVCFTMYAVVYGLGVLTWLMIDPAKPVVPDEPGERS